MRKWATILAGLLCAGLTAGAWAQLVQAQLLNQQKDQPTNDYYPSNRAPLAPSAYVPLPVGAVKPAGWLKNQLTVQSKGLTGHLDEFWPSLMESAWKTGKGGGWERGPYYLDGLVPLAYILEDQRLIEKVEGWMEQMLASGRPDGWFGPESNRDRWPLAVALKVLTQYHEATGDERAINLMQGYFRYLATHPPDWPDNTWRGVRAMEHVIPAYWLYNRTGDPQLLEIARSIYVNSYDWYSYFLDFPYDNQALAAGIDYGHPSHIVNMMMAIKYPGFWSQQSHSYLDQKAVYEGLKSMDHYHGQVTGRIAGDEHLSGRRPTQGTELCGVVEFMYSLENLLAAMGDPQFADRLEVLAYNAKPGTCTPDYWAHQYDQQANQVLVSVDKRNWSTNGDWSNVYGLEPNFGCCTANMHQGWPKFVAHMWMATRDNGLAAIALGPSRVQAKVGGNGTEVTVIEETEYPFKGEITFTIQTPSAVEFPLQIRIPDWANGAELTVGDQKQTAIAGSFTTLRRKWADGDTVTLRLPMTVRFERRYHKAVSVLRGPLYYALKIGEEYTSLNKHSEQFPSHDWKIEPTTPWNYALQIDWNNPQASVDVKTSEIGEVPFEQEAAPVVIRMKGSRLPGWELEQNSAGETPVSPVESDQPLEDLELIPYGSTRLRITEFPVLEQPEQK